MPSDKQSRKSTYARPTLLYIAFNKDYAYGIGGRSLVGKSALPISRRRFILLTSAGIALAAGATAGGFVATRRPDKALEPWNVAGKFDDPRIAALSWAILAPNPHNRQPWIAELVGDDSLLIWRDGTLNLPETDPFDRQLTIGMGCFLEVFRQAAADEGFATNTVLFPEGDGGAVAQISLSRGGQPDPLFQFVPTRHTNRLAYEDRQPPDDAVAAMAPHASSIIQQPDQVQALRDLTWEAMHIEMTTHRTHMESVNLMRFGKAEINDNPDGISLRGGVLEAMMALGMMTREGQSDSNSSEFQQTADFLRTAMEATPAYATITTSGNSRADQIEAGRRWVRLQLAATSVDMVMQPVSQALQEYEEQAELYARVHKMLARPGETVQMLGRLGFAKSAGPSPRWPVESRIGRPTA